jgi:hypothetical protein
MRLIKCALQATFHGTFNWIIEKDTHSHEKWYNSRLRKDIHCVNNISCSFKKARNVQLIKWSQMQVKQSLTVVSLRKKRTQKTGVTLIFY